MWKVFSAAILLLVTASVASAQANNSRTPPPLERIGELEKQVADLQRQLSDMKRQLSEMQKKLDAKPATAANPPKPSPLTSSAAPRNNAASQRGDQSQRSLGKVGDVEVKLLGYGVQKIPLKVIGGNSESKEDLLMVKLEIVNGSTTRKADYKTWRGGPFILGDDVAGAKDSYGNSLKRINFGLGSLPVGAVERADSIYPGKSLTDVLVFEAPVQGATSVEITMPEGNIGGEGKITFKIDLK